MQEPSFSTVKLGGEELRGGTIPLAGAAAFRERVKRIREGRGEVWVRKKFRGPAQPAVPEASPLRYNKQTPGRKKRKGSKKKVRAGPQPHGASVDRC